MSKQKKPQKDKLICLSDTEKDFFDVKLEEEEELESVTSEFLTVLDENNLKLQKTNNDEEDEENSYYSSCEDGIDDNEEYYYDNNESKENDEESKKNDEKKNELGLDIDDQEVRTDIAEVFDTLFHPLEIDEIEEDEDLITDPQEPVISQVRSTFPYLTLYEYVLILSLRSSQIANGSPIFIDLTKIHIKNPNPFKIAKEELNQKLLPFKLKRPLPNGKVEIWELHELEIIY